MKRRLISFLMVCCMLLSVLQITAVAAQVPPTIEPQWTNTITESLILSFSGTTGYVSISILGYSGVSNITADLQVYYKNSSGKWVAMPQHYSYDVDQLYLTTEETFTGISGREYKAVMTATVTKNGYSETINDTATATCPTSP